MKRIYDNYSDINHDADVHCICGSTIRSGFMIVCQFCKNLYHGKCVGVRVEDTKVIDKYGCQQCCMNMLKDSERAVLSRKNSARNLSKNEDIKEKCHSSVCWKEAGSNSHYCYDCEMENSRKLITEHIPAIMHYCEKSCKATKEVYNNLMTSIQVKVQKIKPHYIGICMNIENLVSQINKFKHPDNKFIKISNDRYIRYQCMSCGEHLVNVPTNNPFMPTMFDSKTIKSIHQINCVKINKAITMDEDTNKDDFLEIFCNEKINEKKYCKKIKSLCPFHKKNNSRDSMCAYYLGEENGVDTFCGHSITSCITHHNWQQYMRAKFDLKKLRLFLKIKKLKEKEEKIRKEMTRIGYIKVLLLPPAPSSMH